MAVSDVWKAIETLREALNLSTIDVSYYLVLGGLVLMVFAVSYIAGVVVYKVINNAANADAIGFVKSIVVIALAIFILGLILP